MYIYILEHKLRNHTPYYTLNTIIRASCEPGIIPSGLHSLPENLVQLQYITYQVCGEKRVAMLVEEHQSQFGRQLVYAEKMC